jgi:hypothetical protein
MTVAYIAGYCVRRSLSGEHLAGLRPAEIVIHESTRRLAERRAGGRAQPGTARPTERPWQAFQRGQRPAYLSRAGGPSSGAPVRLIFVCR